MYDNKQSRNCNTVQGGRCQSPPRHLTIHRGARTARHGDSQGQSRINSARAYQEDIANELRHQYNVLYRPEPLKADGLYHSVDIKVRGRKDLLVRVRKGYYAPRV